MKGFANRCQAGLVSIARLEKTTVLIEDFVSAVAGELFEGRVHVNQDVIFAFLFCDHDAVV
ncbi:hypothetical protein D3C87_2177200 [compost metagenome]